MSNDRGSASIWVLACSLVLLAFGYAITVRSAAVSVRHHAENAADLAALAAAGQIGVAAANVCPAARVNAAQNRAKVIGCTPELDPSGRTGSVRVTVRVVASLPIVGTVAVHASARAGRLAASSAFGVRTTGKKAYVTTAPFACLVTEPWALRSSQEMVAVPPLVAGGP